MGSKGVIKNTLSWVLEESEIELDLYDSLNAAATASTSSSTDSNNLGDAVLNPPEGLPGRTMRVWTRNLDHTTAMAVTEGILMKESVEFQDRKVFEKAKGKGRLGKWLEKTVRSVKIGELTQQGFMGRREAS